VKSNEDCVEVVESESVIGDGPSPLQVQKLVDADNVGKEHQMDSSFLGRHDSFSVNGIGDTTVDSGADRGVFPVAKARSFTSSESVSKKRGRACSCPPRAARSLVSGPWSLESLSD